MRGLRTHISTTNEALTGEKMSHQPTDMEEAICDPDLGLPDEIILSDVGNENGN